MGIKYAIDISYRSEQLLQEGGVAYFDIELQHRHLIITCESVSARDT